MLTCDIFNAVTLKHSTNMLLIANKIFSPSIPLCFPSPPSLLPFSLKKEWTGVNLYGRSKTNCSLWLSPVHQTTCWSFFWGRIALCESFRSVMLCNLSCDSLNCLHLCTARDQYFSFYKGWKYRLTTELEGFLLCRAAGSRLACLRSICLSGCCLYKTGCY